MNIERTSATILVIDGTKIPLKTREAADALVDILEGLSTASEAGGHCC